MAGMPISVPLVSFGVWPTGAMPTMVFLRTGSLAPFSELELSSSNFLSSSSDMVSLRRCGAEFARGRLMRLMMVV